jgi:hypothetical protein
MIGRSSAERILFHNKVLIRLLILWLIIIQVAFFLSTYLTSALKGQLDYPKIFISHAIQYDPGRAIAAWLLPLTSFILLWVIGTRLYRQHKFLPIYASGCPRGSNLIPQRGGDVEMTLQSPTSRQRRQEVVNEPESSISNVDRRQYRRAGWARLLFWLIVILLVVFCITMVGVSSVSIQTNRWVHWVIAGLMFLAGILIVVCFPIVDHLSDLIFPRWLWIVRWFLAITVLLLGIILTPFSATIKLVGAIIEIIIVVIFIIYTVTFAHWSEFPLKSRYDTVDEDQQRRSEEASVPPMYT